LRDGDGNHDLAFIVVGGLNGLDSMSPVRRLREKMKAVLFARKG
jgi:hypothetical protein